MKVLDREAAARRLAAGLDPDDDLSGAGTVVLRLGTDDEPFRRRARLTWAALIKPVFEVDPMLCPFWGRNENHRLHHRARHRRPDAAVQAAAADNDAHEGDRRGDEEL